MVSEVYEGDAPEVRYSVPQATFKEYKTPPGVTIRLDPGDSETGLDIEVTVRSNVENKFEMLNRARRGLTEAIRTEDEDGG